MRGARSGKLFFRLEAGNHQCGAGLLLFIYINKWDEYGVGRLRKFADDTRIDSEEGYLRLQLDLDHL